MTVFLVEQQEVLFAGFRFTTQTNQISESMETAELNATVLGNSTTINEPGLKGYGFSGEGFWEGGDTGMDKAIQDRFRTSDVPFSLLLDDGSVGSPCRAMQAMVGGYQIGDGAVGELLPVSFELGAMNAPVRGSVLHNSEATGNVTGTAIEEGAVSSTQTLYAALHVFSGSGQLEVDIQSDDAQGFSSPTTQLSFANVLTGTAQASEWKSTTGAITDTWWRVSATNPATRDFAVIIAIQ